MTDNKKVEITLVNDKESIRELPDSSYEGAKRLFILAFNNTDGDANRVDADSFKKYSLPRIKIKNYNIEIDGRNFYD